MVSAHATRMAGFWCLVVSSIVGISSGIGMGRRTDQGRVGRSLVWAIG